MSAPADNSLTRTLVTRFGLNFVDGKLLDLALRHPSRDSNQNNQRLEFLGDRVLGLVIAETLYRTYPDENEGKLALRHAALVRADMVAARGRELGLPEVLNVSNHDRASGTAQLDNVVADALEALIGALYLDQGLDPCARLIRRLWAEAIQQMTEPPQDPKTALQEWTQARDLPLPRYDLVARAGPDHAPIFTISVEVIGFPAAIATGPSRRLAEKAAAADLLLVVQNNQKKLA